MGYILESAHTFFHGGIAEFLSLSDQPGSHVVIHVVFTLKGELMDIHFKSILIWYVNHYFIIFIHIGARLHALSKTERKYCCYGLTRLQSFQGERVVRTIDEQVFRPLITDDPELGINVVLQLIFIAVKMIRRDVKQHGYVGTEMLHIVKHETTDLQHVIIMLFICHLEGKAFADIAR